MEEEGEAALLEEGVDFTGLDGLHLPVVDLVVVPGLVLAVPLVLGLLSHLILLC